MTAVRAASKDAAPWLALLLPSAALLACAWRSWLPLSITEALGFVTGLVCVWLTVRENVWNWPIGIANSIFFLVLFWEGRLFADATLQMVYVVLGALGWYWWLHGGDGSKEIAVSRAGARVLVPLLFVVIAATWALFYYLRSVHDAAPLWDAFTTVLSLAAQFLLTRKFLENWIFWILADVIYVPLYIHRHLYFTGALYVVFLCLCVMGFREWRQSMADRARAAVATAGAQVNG